MSLTVIRQPIGPYHTQNEMEAIALHMYLPQLDLPDNARSSLNLSFQKSYFDNP